MLCGKETYMHIKIYNQYQIELLKAINPILGKYKIPGKVIYEVERILRYKRKTSNDYIVLIMRPIKNDTTDILMELGIYEQEVEIPFGKAKLGVVRYSDIKRKIYNFCCIFYEKKRLI